MFSQQKQIKGAVTIAVTVGVPWIVGVLTFEPIALVGQWLFIILTGLQVCAVILVLGSKSTMNAGFPVLQYK